MYLCSSVQVVECVYFGCIYVSVYTCLIVCMFERVFVRLFECVSVWLYMFEHGHVCALIYLSVYVAECVYV
jgi:hypothetical protein